MGEEDNGEDEKAWSPDVSDERPYLEINFDEPTEITSIATQGANDKYVEKYIVEYSMDGENFDAVTVEVQYGDVFGTERVIFNGNTDSHSVVKTHLEVAIIAKKLRIIPQVNDASTIALRVELFGCAKADMPTTTSPAEPTTTMYEVVNTTQVVVVTTTPVVETTTPEEPAATTTVEVTTTEIVTTKPIVPVTTTTPESVEPTTTPVTTA